MRGVTRERIHQYPVKRISTHTPHAGSDPVLYELGHWEIISTHTPHAGSDVPGRGLYVCKVEISTHTPHAGSDGVSKRHPSLQIISTHTPHAGSDYSKPKFTWIYSNFNPHSPCGE